MSYGKKQNKEELKNNYCSSKPLFESVRLILLLIHYKTMTDININPNDRAIRVCHKKGKIIEENADSYTVSIKLGGVIQHITVTKEYVENQLED